MSNMSFLYTNLVSEILQPLNGFFCCPNSHFSVDPHTYVCLQYGSASLSSFFVMVSVHAGTLRFCLFQLHLQSNAAL